MFQHISTLIIREPVLSMPGVNRLSIDLLVDAVGIEADSFPTEVRAAWDDQNLHVRFTCAETKADFLALIIGGAMANTYDPFDFVANAAGVALAVVVDAATSRRPATREEEDA